jgi:UDP-3-O-[3-hydroxymyristoyl] N-acetylglucosamine deacetylase
LHNAVVVDGARILNPGGLRHSDEPVRHKMLDVMGDLAVAGAPVLGRYLGYKAGHTLTGRLLRALMTTPASYERVTLSPEQAHDLPGAGVSMHDLLAPAA